MVDTLRDFVSECYFSFPEQEGPPPQIYVNKGRRRSSVVRQDPEEILRSLKACKGDMLSRQMSLTGSEKRASISYRRKFKFLSVTYFAFESSF